MASFRFPLSLRVVDELMDRVVITTAGAERWLWRAVDQQGIVLDILIKAGATRGPPSA